MNQPRVIKCLVLGLPIGLFLTGAGSLVWHFRHPEGTTKQPENQPKSKPVNQSDLEFYVKRIANDIGPRPATDAAKTRQMVSFIEGSLGANNIGYTKVLRETFTLNGQEQFNLSVEVPGTADTTEYIIVAAHYDSLTGNPGANANGTGVAANLALANLFLGTKPARTLQFRFFGNGLGGSSHGAEPFVKISRGKDARIVVVLSLDTLGNFTDTANSQTPWPNTPIVLPPTGNFLAFVGQASAKSLLEECSSLFTTHSSMTAASAVVADSGNGIERIFAGAAFPAVVVTDTGNLRQRSLANPLDTPDNVNFPQFTEAVRGLGRTIEKMANPPR